MIVNQKSDIVSIQAQRGRCICLSRLCSMEGSLNLNHRSEGDNHMKQALSREKNIHHKWRQQPRHSPIVCRTQDYQLTKHFFHYYIMHYWLCWDIQFLKYVWLRQFRMFWFQLLEHANIILCNSSLCRIGSFRATPFQKSFDKVVMLQNSDSKRNYIFLHSSQ